VLHRVLSAHLATFLARVEADETRAGLPRRVRRELTAFLRCGILAYGFARVHCASCGKDALVAFSCKGRGFCPSCGARRMAEAAAHLVERVLPEVPVRQWVLTMPWRLRFLLASDPALCAAVRRTFLRAVLASYRERAARDGIPAGRTGSVTVVQRFGSALNLNVHFHALVLDGVYTSAGPLAQPEFHTAEELEPEEVERLVRTVRERILRLLRRRGLLPAAGEERDSAQPEELLPQGLLPFLAAASIQGRIALGPDSGRPIERRGRPTCPTRTAPRSQPGRLCAAQDGFSLHAEVRVESHARQRLEHLCRYVLRPPIATERLSLADDGKVVYALRHPWRDGTAEIVFDPLTFLERLAALVPRPRAHLLTYHGVLAPASDWRDWIVPAAAPAKASAVADPPRASAPERMRWAELMRRVFELDVLRCEHCGGRRKLIALIQDPFVARRILEHLGLPSEPPPVAPARAPPQGVLTF